MRNEEQCHEELVGDSWRHAEHRFCSSNDSKSGCFQKHRVEQVFSACGSRTTHPLDTFSAILEVLDEMLHHFVDLHIEKRRLGELLEGVRLDEEAIAHVLKDLSTAKRTLKTYWSLEGRDSRNFAG